MPYISSNIIHGFDKNVAKWKNFQKTITTKNSTKKMHRSRTLS